ncbi:MAG: hypothetical protein AB1324_02920 [Candidatus Micrarchaeota archaeon]
MIGLLFSLFLPLAALVAGCYLIWRGHGRSKTASALSGTASSPEPVESLATGRKCIYSKTVVEYYGGGPDPWKTACSAERRAPFSVGGRNVDPEGAEFHLSRPLVITGYARREKGMFEEFADSIAKSSTANIAKSVLTSITMTPGEKEEVGDSMIDDSVMLALVRNPALKPRLLPHIKKALRITEYSLFEGAKVSLVGGMAGPSGRLAASAAAPLIVSDEGAGAAKSDMSEKAFVSVALGAALIMVSIVLFALILLSF